MCGRYVAPDQAALERFWAQKFDGAKLADAMIGDLAGAEEPNYNTLPTQMVPVMVLQDGQPTVTMMRWGMDRYDAAEGRIDPKKQHNARLEGYRKVPMFAGP